MSYWGVHIGVAVIATTLILFLVAPGYRYRGPLVVASGLWAIVPDTHHVLRAVGLLPSVQVTWKALHNSPMADLFWFHRTIDRLDPGDSVTLSLSMWVATAVFVVASELVLRAELR